MKVLFAVSNEEISESIVKKYQKEYKQIISYKNVYYFNAILKEIQKDKSYDRIVISEDLEAFTHTQYDQIDKFIFEKLDAISDEASNSRGNDIPIILICADRRTKSEPMLIKLFGIGVYNAIIGNDRSVDEVCRLINRPRVKKEAKTYYKIDAEEVSYQAENENDVSEMEIQNIVAHYKRLGKNEDRYIDSFNNIAAQYNDTQLRIITKFLPLNVRAVLEEKSQKYQQIMSFNNSVSDSLRKGKDEKDDGPSQVLLKSKNKGNVFSKPVVIPSSVNMKGTKKLAKKRTEIIEPVKRQPIEEQQTRNNIQPIAEQQTRNNIQPSIEPQIHEQPRVETIPQNRIEPIVENVAMEDVVQPVKKGRGRPRKNPLPMKGENDLENNSEELLQKPAKRKRGRPRKNPLPIQEENILPGFEEIDTTTDTLLPGFEEIDTTTDTILPGFEESNTATDTILPGFEEESNIQKVQHESVDNILPGFDEPEPIINNRPQVGKEREIPETSNNYVEDLYYANKNKQNSNKEEYEEIDLTNLLTSDKKIVTFVGTSKNGTSFIVNNIAELLSSIGVNTAILDTTQNRNSYYIYTKNEEDLREIASNSIEGLAHGVAKGVSVNKNLTVYTSLPNDNEMIGNADKILETLLENHSLILIDTDFDTPSRYFEQSQETYLVQTMDILTIQPLTAFLKSLKAKNILDEKKLRVVLNKFVKIRGIKEEVIIGGIAFYNDPAMSFMTELFDKDRMKFVTIPFEDETYVKYLEGIIECEISLKGYSKIFIQALRGLGNMIYPIINSAPRNTKGYRPPSANNNRPNNFSSSMNNTLDKMKRNY